MRGFWMFLVAAGLGAKRHWHILIAIVLGVLGGMWLPVGVNGPTAIHDFFDLFGQLFIRLIVMIVIPLVVSSLIVGICSLGDSRQLGRMGAKVLGYFFFLMLVAAVIGAGLAYLMQPGLQLHSGSLNMTLSMEQMQQLQMGSPDLKTLVFNMIPKNPIASLANADLIPVIIFTIMFGAAIASIGDAGKPIVGFFEALFTATMKLTDWIMIFAVPGVFCLAFTTVAKSGLHVFVLLAPYVIVFMLALLVQVAVVLPLMLNVLAKINFMNLYRAVSEAIMVAFGTASSSATLPITIACCERRAGISNRIASFVLPTGATINKTGTTLFEVIAVIFLAQAYNLPLEPYHYVMIVIFAMIASVGAAGVPSAGLMTIAIVFKAINPELTPETFAGGLALLWSIDRVLDMCRTVVNVLSSCTVAALVASSEGELNRDLLNNQDQWTEVV